MLLVCLITIVETLDSFTCAEKSQTLESSACCEMGILLLLELSSPNNVFIVPLFRFKCGVCKGFILGTRFCCYEPECQDFFLCIVCQSR